MNRNLLRVKHNERRQDTASYGMGKRCPTRVQLRRLVCSGSKLW